MTSMISRRSVVAGALTAVLDAHVGKAAAVPVSTDDAVPPFISGPYQFTTLQPARRLPPITLVPLAGRPLELASLSGTPILLNFWATWCAACRTELPILDRLSQRSRQKGLHVIAVSVDRTDREVVARFAQVLDVRRLRIFLDPQGNLAYSDRDNKNGAPFALYGMPITYAVAASGQIIGYMPGAADWMSEQGTRLIDYLRYS